MVVRMSTKLSGTSRFILPIFFLHLVLLNKGYASNGDELLILSDASEDKSTRISKHPVILIISFDGFRFDYFKRAETLNLDYLKKTGASLPYMKNQFATKTFPNHMSIATGLHVESHGVVENSLYDPFYGEVLESNTSAFWDIDNKTLPLWTLNEEAGDGRRSGCMMWPGSNQPYGPNKTLPSKYRAWNGSVSFEARVDEVVNWITDEETPVNLVFMYFEEPDELAHAFGPESQQVTHAIKRMDNLTGYLISKLKKMHIFELVNLIFLSDHGFHEVRQSDIIQTRDIVNKSLYRRFGGSPVVHLLPNSKQDEATVYLAFKEASNHKNFSVYNKSELSSVKTWHYSNNRRIMPIVLVADLGFVFDDFEESIDYYNQHYNRTPSIKNVYGTHGYDNRVLPMHPFLIAHGPLFKRRFEGEPFENIDIFPLICFILNIPEPPNNGSMQLSKKLLEFKQGFSVRSPLGYAIGGASIIAMAILVGILSALAKPGSYQADGYDYRFINRRNSTESMDENENGIMEKNHQEKLGKDEYQALLMSSSTEEV